MKKTTHVSKVMEWDSEKGSGLLINGDDFFTVSAHQFDCHHRIPREDDKVRHNLERVEEGPPVVKDAVLLRARGLFYDLRDAWPSLLLVLPILALLLAPLPFGGFWHGLSYLFIISLLTYLLYHCNEFLRDGIGNIQPDSALHFLELVGGWFGSIAAQKKLHCYEGNMRYQLFFWMAVLLWQGISLDAIFDWSIASNFLSSLSPVVSPVKEVFSTPDLWS